MTVFGPKGPHKAYTVGELITALKAFHPDMKVKITDPDTGWTIPTILLWVDGNNTVWIDPCDYTEMYA